MNRYDFLIYESRQGEASIEAESPKEARDKLMELYKAGGIEFTFVTGTDNEILNITPLKAVPLQRFEIFGKEALFTDLPVDKVDALQGADKLFRYDLRHGDDDSIPLKVQPEVTVNCYGTVFTAEPLFMEGEFSRDLYDEDWGFLSDEPPMTPEQFYNAMQEKERQTVREYEIYQLNAGGRDQMFMNMKELRAMHVTPNIASYDSVYKGTLEPGMTLDSLYTKFNVERPEDFMGHGIQVNVHGMACCPFHDDTHPSMKLDERYYCFGCHASGDAIDFVSNLFRIGRREAAVKIAEDFHIPYDPKGRFGRRQPVTLEQKKEWEMRQLQKDFREWRGKALSGLNGDYRILTERAEQHAPTDRDAPFPQGFVQAYNDRTLVEFYIGLLETAPRETQINLYLHDRAAIAALDDRINGCGQQRTSVREKLEKKKNLLKAQRDKVANQQQRAAI